ncbi:alkylphosphonate transporter [Mycolicibacterium litorale]|nr:alkylphosphonate transporter [Mycolicibacterium litorale]
MRDGGFTSFLDFRFAENPQCPRCGGRRTQDIVYGMPVDPESWEPWLSMGGCCPTDERQYCTLCDHSW